MFNTIKVNNTDTNYTHSIFDISEYTGKTYDTLSDALADVPPGKQKGGMTVNFVSTSDNNYVKFFCTADEFTTNVTKWQGVDDVPTAGSNNLVKSGAIDRLVGRTMDATIGGFNAYGNLTDITNRARLIIINPKATIYSNNTDFTFTVFANNDGIGSDVENVIPNQHIQCDVSSVNKKYIWLLIKNRNNNDYEFTPSDVENLISYGQSGAIIKNSNNIIKEEERAEKSFNGLALVDSTTESNLKNRIDVTLEKNDGTEQSPDIRILDSLTIPTATNSKAGLIPARSEWDTEPTVESINLINSNGIEKGIERVNQKIGTYTPKLGAFNTNKQIIENNTRAYIIIFNPKATLCVKNGYRMSIFRPDGNSSLTNIVQNVKKFDLSSSNYDYIWVLIKDVYDNTRSFENDNLNGILYIDNSVVQNVTENIKDIKLVNNSLYSYITKSVDSDFSEVGAYAISDAGVFSYNSSVNLLHRIIPIEELAAINVVTVPSNNPYRVPAIIYLKASSPISENVIKDTEQWGTESYGTGFVRFNSKLLIPSDAKYAIVNCKKECENTSVTYKIPKSGPDSIDKEQFLELNWNYGYYKVDANDGLTHGDTVNWLNILLKLEDNGKILKAIDVVGSIESLGVAAIIYLSSSEPIEANRVGQEYGNNISGNYNRFKGDITIPAGATYAIVNCFRSNADDSLLTFNEPINNSVNRLLTQIQLVEKKKVVTVDVNGNGDFTTIEDAIRFTSNGDTILIYPGIYEEVLNLDNNERHLVGVCRESCILKNGFGDYEHQPLRMNIGSIENMTVIADTYDSEIVDPTTEQVRTAYALHIENSHATAYTLTIRNCTFLSKWNAAIGLGLRYNQTVVIENCDIISECVQTWSSGQNRFVSMGGLFFHNDALETVHTDESGHLILRNNKLYGVNNALCISGLANKAYATVQYINNNLCTKNNGVTNIVEHWVSGDNGRIIKAVNSYGNNIAELNA